MRKLVLFVVVCATLVAFSAPVASAQDIKPAFDQEQVINLVTKVYNTPANDFLLKVGPDHGYRVVFVFEGTRYTFDYNYWAKGIQIWLRPDGTSHPDLVAHCVADENLDGLIDFGSDGHRVFAVADHYRDGSASVGAEYQSHWQAVLNDALTGLASIVYK